MLFSVTAILKQNNQADSTELKSNEPGSGREWC